MEKKEYTFKEISNTLIAADVYYTKENAGSKSPIALHFHGGNFVVGSKALLGEQHVKKLLELGFIVVSANYRLCPTTTVYDGPVQDAFDAYNWARTTLPGLLKSDAGIEADGMILLDWIGAGSEVRSSPVQSRDPRCSRIASADPVSRS
ncbi:hypothetical protein B0J12DRAFT_747092 [Macrophomina phaseolina]|uniref:Alpha/beta hydrolase fold-3 domain-containing protein n=1 Tax=Macrophomina phaseolina TaxID=35725 RepID=A0ABQ8FQT6_9PEZI|nr:hypothetical protein B0J12DRAFT_747092 [Macrophomina phaseolina]